jgi:acetolactate synthase-1/2/3 large subunit
MDHVAPDPKLTASEAFTSQRSNLNVSRLLLEYLKLEGATKLFGIPGGAVIWIIDELKKQRDEFDFFICRHETGAAYIAHGYSRVSGELGVVLTTAGPAATNGLTGSMNAQAANCSLLTITGEIPQQYFGQGYLQEGIDSKLDVNSVYRNAVEYSAIVSSPKNAATLIEQALRDARSQPPRASHLSVPADVAAQCVTNGDKNSKTPYLDVPFPARTDNYRATPSSTDHAQVAATFGEMAAAHRPLIFLGNGARQALADPGRRERFTRLVEKFGFPVMTTPDGKGIFPETHPWSLRNYGMTACSWPDLYIRTPEDPEHYDALLVVGSSLGELATSVVAKDHYSKNLIPTKSFTQVDLDQSVIGRDFPITRGIVGDAGASIDALCALGDEREPDAGAVQRRLALIDGIKAGHSPFADPAGRDSTAAPIHPAALVRVMNECLDEGHIFIDAGNCVGWSLNNLVVDRPLHYHSALDMGPMGFGVGAVVGGKIAAPDVPCVALVGDGAFMMHGSEISTAAQYGVGAIWVVLNDDDLSMVSQGMEDLYPEDGPWNGYYKLGAPDLVKYSEGLGATAVAITRDQGPAEFEAALKAAIRGAAEENKPQVIVAHIDTKPMPPYGWPKLPEPPCTP